MCTIKRKEDFIRHGQTSGKAEEAVEAKGSKMWAQNPFPPCHGSLKEKLGYWMKNLQTWLAEAWRAALALHHAKVPRHKAEGEWAGREDD